MTFFLCAVSKRIECICALRWKALTGDDSICECCDSQCVTSKPRRTMMEGTWLFQGNIYALISNQIDSICEYIVSDHSLTKNMVL